MAITRVVEKDGRVVEYDRRQPEKSVLYKIVQEHGQTLFAQAEAQGEHGYGYPAHVKREFERYQACGILQHGFARIACDTPDCKSERLVAYSCKGRSICPSCVARRMADGAAHLVDNVLPIAPYRQWTLSLPYRTRYRIGYDKARISKVLSLFLRAVFACQRTRARRMGIKKPLPAAVTLCQRFGSLLQFSPHFHSWLPDGVFYLDDAGKVAFAQLEPPTDREIESLVLRIESRIESWLCQDEFEDVDEEQKTQVVLATDNTRVGTSSTASFSDDRPLCARSNGYSLHADLLLEKQERKKLERCLRYGLRHPFAQRRLSLSDDGRVHLKLRKPFYTGQTHLTLEPVEFLRRLAATVPPKRLNMVRFHGAFAPRSKVRSALASLLPKPPATKSSKSADAIEGDASDETADKRKVPYAYRRPWAELLKRVFDLNILDCPQCSSKMRNISHIEKPETIASILSHLGLPTNAPMMAPARAPPQLDFDLDGEFDAAAPWD